MRKPKLKIISFQDTAANERLMRRAARDKGFSSLSRYLRFISHRDLESKGLLDATDAHA